MILNMYDSKDNSFGDMLKKSKGVRLIRKYLPHIDANKQFWIVNSAEEWEQIQDRFPEIVTCRTDTIVGTEIPNVHGVTRKKEFIKDYMQDVKKKVDTPYFMCLELEEGTNERIYTCGGIVIDAVIGQDIKIGYVGPGFDCGELTKGQAEHETWVIPWEKNAIKRKDSIDRYRIQKMSQSSYAPTALKRMAFLIREYPDREQEILDVFAKRYPGINPNLFRKIQEEILIPLWERQEEMVADGLSHFGVELNVVSDNRLIPFEIETPEISRVNKSAQKNVSRGQNKSNVQAFPKINLVPDDKMTYGKAKGIVLLQKYLPGLNPFKSIEIVHSIDEWEKVKDKYPDRLSFRTDAKIGDPRNIRIEGASGKKEEVADVFKKIKTQNPDAVILLFQTKEPTLPRYENDGGFNVGFFMNEYVIIELVGKGFDGRELTRGKGVHEKYIIPWSEILFMRNKHDLMKSRIVEKYSVSQEEYQKTRESRIEFLKSIETDESKIEESVPETYTEIDNSVIDSILNDVVFTLYKRKSELPSDGLKTFNVQGNIVNGKVVPWEIFRPERLIPKTRDIGEK